MTPVRTVFLGSGGFGIPTLRAVAEHPALDLVAVVTAPPRPAGRKRELTGTPIGTAAGDLHVPVLTPERLRAAAALDEILRFEPGLVVLADYGQIVPAPLLALRHGALNLHPSLLPRHRGATPIPAAILAGDPLTGVTLMRMDAGLDTGPIVAQTRWALDGTERASELEPALAQEAARLLDDSLEPYLRGELIPVPQPATGMTLTRPLRREDGRLDPRATAVELERQVRAYDRWPGTYLETTAGRLVVLLASVADAGPGDEPGEFRDDDGELFLATAQGRLRLERVQPAGGTPMIASVFLRGRARFAQDVRVIPPDG